MFSDIFVKRVFILLLFFQCSSALFEYCNNAYNVDTVGMYISSPYYSSNMNYPTGTSCRYALQTLVDYQIQINCNIYMPYTSSGCSTEFFYIELDGNSNYPVNNSTYYCGQRSIIVTSYFNAAVIAYSSSRGGSGRFSCFMKAVPQPQESCECGWTVSRKITNGIEAGINEYPFMAGLIHISSPKVFCGATIISHRCLLTAAHCLSAHNISSEIVAVVGEHDITKKFETYYSSVVGIQSYTKHSLYDTRNQQNDIAVLYTVNDILWSGGVGPACLPFLIKYSQFNNERVDIIGWGSTAFGYPPSDFLRKATVYAISNSECSTVIKDLKPNQICTYSPPRDACSFDSGGPVVYKNQRSYTVGITSFGIACGTNQPSVNTRVTSYLDWIVSATPGVFYCRK